LAGLLEALHPEVLFQSENSKVTAHEAAPEDAPGQFTKLARL
jgi:hypothetical protein